MFRPAQLRQSSNISQIHKKYQERTCKIKTSARAAAWNGLNLTTLPPLPSPVIIQSLNRNFHDNPLICAHKTSSYGYNTATKLRAGKKRSRFFYTADCKLSQLSKSSSVGGTCTPLPSALDKGDGTQAKDGLQLVIFRLVFESSSIFSPQRYS